MPWPKGQMRTPTWLSEYVRSDVARERARQLGLANRTHGATTPGTPLFPTYRSWQAMKRRCDNPRDTYYASYGGRGITYDPRWTAFEVFLADMGPRPEGRTLDRIDSDGNYGPDTGRWATRSEQAKNRKWNPVPANAARRAKCAAARVASAVPSDSQGERDAVARRAARARGDVADVAAKVGGCGRGEQAFRAHCRQGGEGPARDIHPVGRGGILELHHPRAAI